MRRKGRERDREKEIQRERKRACIIIEIKSDTGYNTTGLRDKFSMDDVFL